MEWGGALAPGTCRIRRYRAPPGVCGHDIALGLSSRARLRAPPSRKGRQSRARRTPVWHARPRTVVTGYELVRVIHAYACATRTRCGGGHAHAGPPRTWWQVWAVHPVCSTLSTAGGARPTLVQDSIAVWAPHPHVTLSRAGGSRPTLAQDSSGVGAPPARDHCLPDTLAVTRVECLPAPPLLAVWAA